MSFRQYRVILFGKVFTSFHIIFFVVQKNRKTEQFTLGLANKILAPESTVLMMLHWGLIGKTNFFMRNFKAHESGKKIMTEFLPEQ